MTLVPLNHTTCTRDDNDRGEDGEIMKAINVVIMLVGLYFEQCMDFKRLLVAKDGT